MAAPASRSFSYHSALSMLDLREGECHHKAQHARTDFLFGGPELFYIPSISNLLDENESDPTLSLPLEMTHSTCLQRPSGDFLGLFRLDIIDA
jgi:hypothetical protein